MEISFNIYVNTYTTQVDKHIVEIEMHNCKKNNFISLWYYYNNNSSSIQLFYDVDNNYLYGANITSRQKNLIIKKIKKAMELQKNLIK